MVRQDHIHQGSYTMGRRSRIQELFAGPNLLDQATRMESVFFFDGINLIQFQTVI